jgi:hypothetical protein
VLGNDCRHDVQIFLEALGLPTDENYIQHMKVFVTAQRIYSRRYPKYKDEPIRQMGVKGVLVQARTCLERLWVGFGPSTPLLRAGKVDDLDDAYDGINYLAHFINQMYARNNGSWRWDDPQH